MMGFRSHRAWTWASQTHAEWWVVIRHSGRDRKWRRSRRGGDWHLNWYRAGDWFAGENDVILGQRNATAIKLDEIFHVDNYQNFCQTWNRQDLSSRRQLTKQSQFWAHLISIGLPLRGTDLLWSLQSQALSICLTELFAFAIPLLHPQICC